MNVGLQALLQICDGEEVDACNHLGDLGIPWSLRNNLLVELWVFKCEHSAVGVAENGDFSSTEKPLRYYYAPNRLGAG